MTISIIVATDLDGAIGKDKKLLWYLPADLKFFKEKTMGHHMIMGRKTYESIGKPLPGRTTVIVTRDQSYKAEGCIVVNSIEEALQKAAAAGETEAMITGGAEIYKLALDKADRIYLTEVRGRFEADTFFRFDKKAWTIKEEKDYKADEKNKFDYRFIILEKN
ncbi:MAG TPA: dihydrofolate reductase [Cytophagaceae bacterium]|nr:dihydrofolate reductase [Cytophagaceae bacterium]